MTHEGEPVVVTESPKLRSVGSTPTTLANALSSNGRTLDFDSSNVGSIPAGATKMKTPRHIDKGLPNELLTYPPSREYR